MSCKRSVPHPILCIVFPKFFMQVSFQSVIGRTGVPLVTTQLLYPVSPAAESNDTF